MKIIIPTTIFKQAVRACSRIINAKNALPILGDILFEVSEPDRALTLTASDGEVWLRVPLTLDTAEGEGRFCVPIPQLMQALASLPEQPLTLIAPLETADLRLTIQHQTGHTVIPLETADQFPAPQLISEGDTLYSVTLNGSTMADDLRRALFATYDSELRPQMTGIYHDFNPDGTYTVVASDGHVLMRIRRNDAPVCHDLAGFIMPKKTAKILPDLISTLDDVKVEFTDRLAVIEQDAFRLTSRLIEGRYPNYNSVIPQHHETRIALDRQAFLQRLRNVQPFANDSSQFVRLSFADSQLTLTAEDYDFSTSATDTMPADIQGPAITVGMKGSSVIALLQKLIQPQVVIKATEPSRALTFEDIDSEGQEGNIMALAMPMLLNE